MADASLLGAKVRQLRRREGITQARLAELLGVSPSYLNLIENNRRPLTAPLLLRLAETFQVELSSFASADDARVAHDLMEVFGDPLFEHATLTNHDVKDLAVSKAFYENLGFTVKGGRMEDNYLVMKNGNALIGLFQGMFEGKIITFNPGWDENGNNADPFTDIREIQKHMKAKGIQLDMEADENTKGPASVMLKDPDGNVILMDQFR